VDAAQDRHHRIVAQVAAGVRADRFHHSGRDHLGAGSPEPAQDLQEALVAEHDAAGRARLLYAVGREDKHVARLHAR